MKISSRKRQVLLVLLLSFLTTSIHAQTILAQDDISVIGFNSNGSPKDFVFVTWKQLDVGTKIRFTDNGFHGLGASTVATNYRYAEQVLTWTANQVVPPGTVVYVGGILSSSHGTSVCVNATGAGSPTSLTLVNNSGDQIFAYQSPSDPPVGGNPNGNFTGTILFGLTYQALNGSTWLAQGAGVMAGSFTSCLPTDLNAPNHIYVDRNATGAEYNGPRTGLSFAQFRDSIALSSKWRVKTATGNLDTIRFNLTSFGMTVLPVRWISFTGELHNGTTQLKWTAAASTNADKFVIERSVDGSTYVEAGKQDIVSTHSTRDYQFTEQLSNGASWPVIYYRVRQTDKDGKDTYSPVVILRPASRTDLLLYPNPVSDRLSLSFPLRRAGMVQLDLMDMTGRVVKSIRHAASAGSNTISIDLQSLKAGTYQVKIAGEGIAETRKVVKK